MSDPSLPHSTYTCFSSVPLRCHRKTVKFKHHRWVGIRLIYGNMVIILTNLTEKVIWICKWEAQLHLSQTSLCLAQQHLGSVHLLWLLGLKGLKQAPVMNLLLFHGDPSSQRFPEISVKDNWRIEIRLLPNLVGLWLAVCWTGCCKWTSVASLESGLFLSPSKLLRHNNRAGRYFSSAKTKYLAPLGFNYTVLNWIRINGTLCNTLGQTLHIKLS